MSEEQISELEEAIKSNPREEDSYLALAYAYGTRYGVGKYTDLWRKMLGATGSEIARKNLERFLLAEQYEKGILAIIENLRNVSLEKFDILIDNQNMTIIEVPDAPETTFIWNEESHLIKAFECLVGGTKLKIFLYYSIRPSQGYMIYISLNQPQICRLEFNTLKMLTRSRSKQLDILYKLKFAFHDNRNLERKSKGLDVCNREGFRIIDDGIHMGSFSFETNNFLDTTSEDFIKNVVKLSMIKGHFSGLFQIESLPHISSKFATGVVTMDFDEEVLDYHLLHSVRHEIYDIRAYLKGTLNDEISNEKLYFWLWFCYKLGLYQEGSLIFRKIDEESINPELYRAIMQIGSTCENKLE